MDCRVISTGSQGNAVIIDNKILIDCGVPFSRLADDYRSLKLVLLTHIHGDHFNSATLRRLARERPTLRFACCVWLCAALVDAGVKASQIDVISTERWYIYNGLCRIKAQETKHDVQNCCWHIELPITPVERVFYATDTNNLNGITAKGYNLYLVEANYTGADIQDRIAEKKINGEYVYEKRVMREHLSKEKADDWLCANMAAYSEYIYMHGHQEKDN